MVTGGATDVVASSLLERGEFGGYNLSPAPRNRAFASSYIYLHLVFRRFQALWDLGLTVLIPAPRLAFR